MKQWEYQVMSLDELSVTATDSTGRLQTFNTYGQARWEIFHMVKIHTGLLGDGTRWLVYMKRETSGK